jgi:hypothetical protein
MWKKLKAITQRNRSLYTGALLTTNENILICLDGVKRVIIALYYVRKDSARIVIIKNGRREKQFFPGHLRITNSLALFFNTYLITSLTFK